MTFDRDLELWVRWLAFVPIIACSIAAVALILSKWLDLQPRRVVSREALDRITSQLRSGNLPQALDHARADGTHASRWVAALIESRGRRESMAARTAHLGEAAARELERGLDGLSLIAVLGPLLGLLGTVVGIVIVFEVLATADGAASPQELAGGIGTALYTTIAGLIVGIIALVGYRVLSARADGAVAVLEEIGLDVMDLLDDDDAGAPTRAAAPRPPAVAGFTSPLAGDRR